MGRPIFSQAYASPAMRTEPEPRADPCKKWSQSNPFDPDSDEFFKDAENEMFTDTDEYKHDQQNLSGGTGSSASSESGASDVDSPMAVVPDEFVDAYTAASEDWQRFNREEPRHYEIQPAYPRITSRNPRSSRNVSAESGEQVVRPRRVTRPRSATVVVSTIHPPSSLRNSTTATELDIGYQSPPIRRTVNITPINIPRQPSTPGPISPDSPSTPPNTLYSRHIQHVFTPSPPPTVTPRLYSWRHGAPPSPTSPITGRNIGGPLTNPGARMSLARINLTPVRVHAGAVA